MRVLALVVVEQDAPRPPRPSPGGRLLHPSGHVGVDDPVAFVGPVRRHQRPIVLEVHESPGGKRVARGITVPSTRNRSRRRRGSPRRRRRRGSARCRTREDRVDLVVPDDVGLGERLAPCPGFRNCSRRSSRVRSSSERAPEASRSRQSSRSLRTCCSVKGSRTRRPRSPCSGSTPSSRTPPESHTSTGRSTEVPEEETTLEGCLDGHVVSSGRRYRW